MFLFRNTAKLEIISNYSSYSASGAACQCNCIYDMSNIESIIQQTQNLSVYKEIESARLMEHKEIEDSDRIKQIDDVQEFNALMDAEVLLNEGNYFDLYA